MLFFIVALTSCSSGDKVSVQIEEKFPENLKLRTNAIKVPVDLLMASKIFIVNDKLVVFDKKKEGIFNVFSLPEVKYLYSWGNYGEGPDEFSNIDPECINISNGLVEIYDNISIKKYEIGEKGFINKGVKKFVIPIGFPINRLVKINDSIYVVENLSDKIGHPEHMIININENKRVSTFGDYPVTAGIDPKDGREQNYTYLKSTVFSHEQKKFFAFYLFFNKFKIYKEDGELIKDITLLGNDKPDFSFRSIKKSRMFHAYPIIVKDKVFVLGLNISKSDYEKNLPTYKPKLHVFDMDGKPASSIDIDEPLVSFAFSEKTGKIYGVTPFSMNEIFEYDLSKKNIATNIQENKYKVTLINQLDDDINEIQNSDNQLVKNESYELKIPRDWRILTSIDKFNEVYTSSEGLMFKACAFAAPKNPPTGINFNIRVIQNAKEKKVTIKKYYEHTFRINKEGRNYKYSNKLKINAAAVESDTYEYDDDRPDGSKVATKMATFVWEVNNKLCVAKFVAPVKLYNESYEKVMTSLKSLKTFK